jgi:hypothetical protein
MHTDFVTIDDRVRAAYQSNPEYLAELLALVNISIRTLLISLAGRDMRVADPHIHFAVLGVGEDYVNGKYDPWHDEGNGTNHRLSQCTERCK